MVGHHVMCVDQFQLRLFREGAERKPGLQALQPDDAVCVVAGCEAPLSIFVERLLRCFGRAEVVRVVAAAEPGASG